jgi:transcription elongation factor Elf1
VKEKESIQAELKDYHPEIRTINIKTATPPTEEQMTHRLPGEYWCPYCEAYEVFKDTKGYGYKHCPVCGISDNDFHVRQINHLGEKSNVKKEDKKKK